MRLRLLLAMTIGMTSAAFASDGFDIVVPSRPGVPIIVNGIDVSYAVLEGEFGLGKGVNNNQPTIYGGRVAEPEPPVGHYYPSLGTRPGYGRLEIEPPSNRRLPQPAESYHQSWGAQSMPLPAQSSPPVGRSALSAARDHGAARRRSRTARFLRSTARQSQA